MSRPNIEAIYPLTFMQQALLFHHIHHKYDQGFLQVQCRLHGPLEPVILEQAFSKTVDRHPALRTSVHWENIKKPVQILHPTATIPFSSHDWRADGPAQQAEKLKTLRTSDREHGFDLSLAPLSNVALIRVKENEYMLLWSCHHIILDGWSAANILKDVFNSYDTLIEGKPGSTPTLPDYRTYLTWIKRQDEERSRSFWKQAMSGFELPSLLATAGPGENGTSNEYRETAFALSGEVTTAVNAYARRNRITVSTVIQGLWAILLGRHLHRRDVVIGTTVSGRGAPIPNLELAAGLFMNVLPVRFRFPEDTPLAEWLQRVQREQIEARNFEHVTLDQITGWTDWPGHLPLFDSLMVVENFPWSELRGGGVVVNQFSGGFTSTYPVTVVVKPGPELEFVIRYQVDRIPEKLVAFLSSGLRSLIERTHGEEQTISELWRSVEVAGCSNSTIKNINRNGGAGGNHFQNGYISPRNPAELKLTGIWEEIFGRHPISIRDDFFQLGGSSLQAVRLFALIEKRLGRSLPPATLLKHRTIESIAQLDQDDQQETWDSLVPIRAGGSKAPLFCVHAGGAHVLFYYALARHLGSDQPVYALQPAGLDGRAALHKSVEEMAAYYVQEIRKVQPEGPYAVLGTCFGNAVCLEMARQFRAEGQSVSLLAIIDSGVYSQEEVVTPGPKERLQRIPLRYERFTQRLRKDPIGALAGIFRARMTRLRIAMEKRFNFLRSRQTRSLYSVQKHLVKLHLQYHWTPLESEVTLIRSSESTENPNLDCHVSQWSRLAKNGLDVFVVPGHHQTLFEEPEVKHLARQLKDCLSETAKNQMFDTADSGILKN